MNPPEGQAAAPDRAKYASTGVDLLLGGTERVWHGGTPLAVRALYWCSALGCTL